MNYELTVYQLGKLLSEVSSTYKTSLLTKINLSGGWMTMQGDVEVESAPTERVMLKGNNIITLKVKADETNAAIVKITGATNGKFNVSVAPKKIVELRQLGLQVKKEKADECTIKVDDGMVFAVSAGVEEVIKLLNN